MKKSTIETAIGIIAAMLLLCILALLTADDPTEYIHGATIGFMAGATLVICLRNRENAKKKSK